jgi:hypothetical protein
MGQHGISLRVAISALRLQQDRIALGLEGDDVDCADHHAGLIQAAGQALEAALARVQGGRGNRDPQWAQALLERLSQPLAATREVLRIAPGDVWSDPMSGLGSFDLPTFDRRLVTTQDGP